MFTAIREILQGSSPKADKPPVRRGSYRVGRCEATFWRSTNHREVRQIILAARRLDLVERKAGRRNGPLGHVALEVLELLGNLVSHRTGQLDPSINTLMTKLKRSKDAVVRALKALREHGFLDWLCRYEPTGLTEGQGPRVRQASNAYRLSLPVRARRLLGRLMDPPPLPDDVCQAQEELAAERKAYRDGLPLDELALFEVQDDRLGQVLASLGRALQERESARQAETKLGKNP